MFAAAAEVRHRTDPAGPGAYKGCGLRAVRRAAGTRRGTAMLETVIVILVVLWLLGLVTSYTMGGFIHVLLVLAVIAILFRLFSGRRV